MTSVLLGSVLLLISRKMHFAISRLKLSADPLGMHLVDCKYYDKIDDQ